MISLKFWGESHASHNIDPRFDSQLSRCSLEVNGAVSHPWLCYICVQYRFILQHSILVSPA